MTAKTVNGSFTAAMDYATELEEKEKAQAERNTELEASVDGQTILTNTMDYAASAVSAGDSK